MALAVSIRYDFRDDKGKASFTKIRIPNGFALADYQQFAQAMGQLIADISNCVITRASICIGIDLSTAAIKAAATGLADVAQKAFFQFNTALAGFRNKFKLPTLDELKVNPNSDTINQADVDVAAFIAAMENGIAVPGPATISPSDQRENDITSISFAREHFRAT